MPRPVRVARAGLLPVPLPSPFWKGPPLEAGDIADPTEATLTAWRQGADGWRGFITWHDRLGLARLTWVDQEHLSPR